MTIKERMTQLEGWIFLVDRCLREMRAEYYALKDQKVMAEHPCTCVKRNAEIGIHTMTQHALACREILGYSCLVPEQITADRRCPDCLGTGKPKTRPTEKEIQQ